MPAKEPDDEPRLDTVVMPAAAGVSEEYIVELVAHALAELTAEFDRKIDAVRAEVKELRAEAIRAFGDRLDTAITKCDALVARLERGSQERGQVIDLPRATRNVN